MRNDRPVFPITVVFSGGEVFSYGSEEEARLDLEFLDTEDSWDPVRVVDKYDRPVSLRIEALQIERLELVELTASHGTEPG